MGVAKKARREDWVGSAGVLKHFRRNFGSGLDLVSLVQNALLPMDLAGEATDFGFFPE